MSVNILAKLYEHNNWANREIIRACNALSDEQLDAEPQSVTKGSLRRTVMHLVGSQQNYLALLTLPVEARTNVPPDFDQLEESARVSGEGLLALGRDPDSPQLKARLQTRDDYYVEPWVIMLQALNHAGEHREQICSMLTALGVTPPDLDGWSFGFASEALVPIEK